MQDAAELVAYADLTAKLRGEAFTLWGWDTDALENLGEDAKRMTEAMTVAWLLDKGAPALAEELQKACEGTDFGNTPGFCDVRMMSLYELLLFWYGHSARGELSPSIPLLPTDAPTVPMELLIDVLTSSGMYAPFADGWNCEGQHGTYEEERYETPGLPVACVLPKWTYRELCCLYSLTTPDIVEDAAQMIVVLLDFETETPYGQIARQMQTENGTPREVTNAALKRLLESGAVVCTKDAVRKVTTWRLED